MKRQAKVPESTLKFCDVLKKKLSFMILKELAIKKKSCYTQNDIAKGYGSEEEMKAKFEDWGFRYKEIGLYKLKT